MKEDDADKERSSSTKYENNRSLRSYRDLGPGSPGQSGNWVQNCIVLYRHFFGRITMSYSACTQVNGPG